MVKLSLKICIFCSSLLLLIVEYVNAHNEERLDLNGTRRIKRQITGHRMFDGWVTELQSKASNPNIRDYNYYGLRNYNDIDFPFEQVITQTVNRIIIPKYIKAKIKSSHVGKPRANIPSQITRYLESVGQYNGNLHDIYRQKDQAGHLLAHSLGGTSTDEFNFVPMSAVLNTQTENTHSLWFGEEGAMRDFLKGARNRRIEWEIIIEHGNMNPNRGSTNPNNLASLPLRPTAFYLRHDNYNEHNILVDNYNVTIRNRKPAMCFSNEIVDDGNLYSQLPDLC